jgi:hypothetical protein
VGLLLLMQMLSGLSQRLRDGYETVNRAILLRLQLRRRLLFGLLGHLSRGLLGLVYHLAHSVLGLIVGGWRGSRSHAP